MSTAIYPEFNPSPGYRAFIERLRLARLERGLSIADMSDEVGLTFRLAHEFENITAPLPFEWLEIWCQTVGVQFEDFLAIYWADEREWQERQDAKEAAQKREASETETPATEPEPDPRSSGVLNPLSSWVDRIARFFRSLFSTA